MTIKSYILAQYKTRNTQISQQEVHALTRYTHNQLQKLTFYCISHSPIHSSIWSNHLFVLVARSHEGVQCAVQQSFTECARDVCERIGFIGAAAEQGLCGFRWLGTTCPGPLDEEAVAERMTQPGQGYGHLCTVDQTGSAGTGQQVTLQTQQILWSNICA